MPPPRICIIGAGPSGLATIKNLRAMGLENLVCYEAQGQVGGNWVYKDEAGHPSVYQSTHIISSKKLSSFDDFPMPADYPDFPSHRQILSYFEAYADHFGLRDPIRFNTKVEHAARLDSGRWRIATMGPEGGNETEFDHLIVCSGHHWSPYTPDCPGIFSGVQIHSHDYRKAKPFEGKRVLVVGGGNSACDIAVDTSRVSGKTAISLRRGYYIIPKIVLGRPVDVMYERLTPFPKRLRQIILRLGIRLAVGRYKHYGLAEPEARVMEMHPTLNSEILYQIRHGNVLVRKGIESLDGATVHFTDGTRDDYDVIVWATGYRTAFPFFDPDFIDWEEALDIPLYLKMMPADVPNLHFIGLFQPIGCIWTLADLQARIAALQIAGKLDRPADIKARIENEIRSPHWRFERTARHAVEVDYHAFKGELQRELARGHA